MLKLPDVTLVMVETREHLLAKLAVEDSLAKAEFGDVLILTDRPELFGAHVASMARFHHVPDWPDKIGWSRSWWHDVPPLLRTPHTLNIQWDSWIFDTSAWRDDFLDYDYIGAPWWYPELNVGNGGFSLVSTRLKKYLLEHKDDYPVITNADDDLLCRRYRQRLEKAGFDWAPEPIAHEFAFEWHRPPLGRPRFGFHGIFNWPFVLDSNRLRERMKIAAASPYIRKSNVGLKVFREAWPDLADELLKDAA